MNRKVFGGCSDTKLFFGNLWRDSLCNIVTYHSSFFRAWGGYSLIPPHKLPADCVLQNMFISSFYHILIDDFLIDREVKLDARNIYFTKYFPYVWTNLQTSKWFDTKCFKLSKISWLIIGIHWEPRKYRPKNESLQCCVFE